MDRRQIDSRLRNRAFQDRVAQRGRQPIDRRLRSTQRSRYGYALVRLIRWVRRYPFASLIIVWASLLVVGVVAAVSLTLLEAQNLEAQNLEAHQQVAEHLPFRATATLVAPEVEVAPIFQPVVLAGAIAFCCAAVCLLWFRATPQRSSVNLVRGKGRSSKVQRSNCSAAAVRSTQAEPKLDHLWQTESSATQLTDTQTTESTVAQSSDRVSSGNTAVGTVLSDLVLSDLVPSDLVPSHQSHPLDWDEPSLADHLDLRHRRLRSDWLE